MADFTPAMLGSIDIVEIVDLQQVPIDHFRDWFDVANSARSVRIKGAAAQQIGELFRTLPADGQMRCHIPPYGLRFHSTGMAVCEASICWKCNNIFGRAGTQKVFFEFDGRSKAARELLAACRLAMNDDEAQVDDDAEDLD